MNDYDLIDAWDLHLIEHFEAYAATMPLLGTEAYVNWHSKLRNFCNRHDFSVFSALDIVRQIRFEWMASK